LRIIFEMKNDNIAKPKLALAGAIARDILAYQRPVAEAPECFSCGRSYSRGDGRFCTPKCREAYDGGSPRYETAKARYSLPLRGQGFEIACAGCNKPFESWGLRCCSPGCERTYRNREDNIATMAEVGMEVSAKRKCECGAHIPKWTPTGKLTKKAVILCPKCVASKGRKSRKGSQVPEPALDRDNDEKVPGFIGLNGTPQASRNRHAA
jgi:hypothetical protein